MKNKRSFFGRLLRGAAVLALTAVLFSALPALKAKAAAGEVTLSDDGTLTLSGEVTKDQIWAYRENNAVKAVTAKKGTVLPADCSELFSSGYAYSYYDEKEQEDMAVLHSYWENVERVDLSQADASRVTDLSRMFAGYSHPWDDDDIFSSYKAINLHGLNTSNVTNMKSMFDGCKKLTALDVSGFDTSKVTDMGWMFYDCWELTSLDLSGFDTSNVTDMGGMFNDCWNLTSLDLSGFDTSKVKNMNEIFQGCRNLTSLDLSSFDTSKVTDMSYMFGYCRSLTSLDLSSFDTSNVTDMKDMFAYCNSLTSLDLSGFDTSKVTGMWEMFKGCTNLTAIYVSDRWSNQAVRDGRKMFEGCASLTGGNGTKYTDDHTDQAYARIDAADRPGYFTGSFFNSMPKNAYGTIGENAVFTVKAAGKNLKYQWQYNNGHGWRNSTQEGCKTATVSVPFLYYRNGQQYRCVVTDAAGKKHNSFSAKMYVRLITAQPKNVTATAGKNAVFTVQAAGNNLKYCWQFNNGHGWKNSGMTGCKTATLTVPATAARNGQQYRCIVTAPNGIREISKEVMMFVK